MLSCEKVQELLPGLLTGEKTPHDVREHLASCDRCREARDALSRELGAMREDFAALAPSPFLEDAVVEAAHEPEAVEPRRRPWRYVVVAFAAAAALFLVVLLPRLQDRGGEAPVSVPGGEDEGGDRLVQEAGAVAVPPSAGEVTEARDWNSRYWSHRTGQPDPDEMAYQTWPKGAPTDQSDTRRFLPPAEEAHHRYVWGDANGRPGVRTHTMAMLPSVEGVFYLGTGLLNEIGGTLHAGTTGEILLGDRRWETTPGTMQGEITVASPDEGGARARVRVLVSTGYSGTLLLEEPLAYALGLHQFEIPGDVEFRTLDGQAIPVHGWRARARVALPELDFDRVVEVQVVPARPWMVRRGRRSEKTGLLFRGLVPTSGAQAENLAFDEKAGELALVGKVRGWSPGEDTGSPLEHVEVEPGTFRFLFVFRPPQGGAVPMLPDVPLLGELFEGTDGVLLPQALDFDPSTLHVIDVERVALNGRWEPGANVTIARVWRGKTAIPSAEAVARTQVSETGRIVFPRIRGEQGSTLRMLVTTKDGRSTFQDVVVSPNLRGTSRLDVALGADGSVRGRSWSVALLDGPWGGDGETGTPPPERFAALVEQLHLVCARTPRDAQGRSKLELVLHTDGEAPWRLVQWVLMAAADPRVQIHRIRIGVGGGTEETYQSVDLPSDEGLSAGPRREHMRVRMILHRGEPGGPLVIRPGSRVGEATPWTWEDLPGRLRYARTEFAQEGAAIHGLIQVPPPGLVTFAEALRLLVAFRQAGFEDVRLEGAPLR